MRSVFADDLEGEKALCVLLGESTEQYRSNYECVVCGKGFSDEEWDDRHDLHDWGCPTESFDDDKDCDYECSCVMNNDEYVHAACCIPCGNVFPVDVIDDVYGIFCPTDKQFLTKDEFWKLWRNGEIK